MPNLLMRCSPGWKEIQGRWLHKLGNLTLTGYNSTYSDRPFQQKKTIDNGFNVSPLRLNRYVSQQSTWTDAQMRERGTELASGAVRIWPALVVDSEDIQRAQLDELRLQASRFSVENLHLTEDNWALFELLRSRVSDLGENVTELFTSSSVVYRVFDFFIEIVPRKRGLLLSLNLDFDVNDRALSAARDISDYAFVPNATETGGTAFDFEQADQIEPAMELVKRAYQTITE